jgi:hypothetical protein
MEKVTTKPEFLERLKDLKSLEISARDSYEKEIKGFSDENLVNPLRKIKLDEDKHISLINTIIEIVQNAQKQA